MRTDDIQFMVDIGILNPRADEFTAFLLWGKVIADPVLRKRMVALCDDRILSLDDPRRNVRATLTDQDKIELRDRVLATCRNGKA
jgi:hypothetical protein